MPRPELGPLAKGDVVLMCSRGVEPRAMTVVTLGPKWVGIVDAKWLESPFRSSYVRRFLLADQQEGEPRQRVGYQTRFATRAQYEWDVLVEGAREYVRQAGLDVLRTGGPFVGEDGILKLAHILSLMESSWRT